jgi:hypothetical protein
MEPPMPADPTPTPAGDAPDFETPLADDEWFAMVFPAGFDSGKEDGAPVMTRDVNLARTGDRDAGVTVTRVRLTPSAPERETCWLIERGQAQHQRPTIWWIGGPEISGDKYLGWWTEVAHKANRYATRDEAEQVIQQSVYLRGTADATEHVFIGTTPPSAPSALERITTQRVEALWQQASADVARNFGVTHQEFAKLLVQELTKTTPPFAPSAREGERGKDIVTYAADLLIVAWSEKMAAASGPDDLVRVQVEHAEKFRKAADELRVLAPRPSSVAPTPDSGERDVLVAVERLLVDQLEGACRCGDPDAECVMQDARKPSDDHQIVLARVRARLASSPAPGGREVTEAMVDAAVATRIFQSDADRLTWRNLIREALTAALAAGEGL